MTDAPTPASKPPVRVSVTYEGELRCRAVHGPSGAELVTEAPADNQGKGSEFSPTDLVGTALGTCVLTIMAIAAEKQKVDITGASAVVEKEMIADPRRRIARLTVKVTVPTLVDEKDRRRLEAAARACPVHRSFGDRIDAPITFEWADR